MKVLVNLGWLVPGVVGGSEEAMVELLRALGAWRTSRGPGRGRADLDLHLVALPQLAEAHPDLARAFPLTTLRVSGRAKPARVAAEYLRLSLVNRRRGPRFDVVHQAGGTSPGWVDAATVLTVHDLQPLQFPEHFGRAKVEYLRRAVPRAARRAEVVAVPSEFVRASVIERLEADASQVVVVPHAVPEPLPGADRADVRRRYDLPGRWLVLNAITYPHKDHLTAVRAFGRLASEHADLTLVLAGGRGPSEHAVADEIERLGLTGRVRRTGRVSGTDLAGLVAGAEALVFPSRYEGFGLPVIEAMGRGTPVVAARAGSVPEVAGGAALLVEPGDDEAIAEHLRSLLGDPERRRAVSAAGRDRAREFRPSVAAAAMTGAYRLAASRR